MINKLKFKNEKLKINKGFTLVELLVVMIVILAVGSVVVSVILSTLRGANKANSLDNVRRNGNYAVAQITKMIRYAQSFNGVSSESNWSDFTTYRTNCVPITFPTPTPVFPPIKHIWITNFDGGQTVFSCRNGSGVGESPEISSRSALTGDTVQLVNTGSVQIVSCAITCQQTSTNAPPIVTVNFSLSNAGSQQAGGLQENQANVTFQTSVTVRNY